MNILSTLKASQSARNLFIVLLGTGAAQFIALAVSPLLTRLYSPDDFGILAIFTSICGIITVIATARLELAIVLPKEENEAETLFSLAVVISFFASLLTFVCLLLAYLLKLDFTVKLGFASLALIPVYIFTTACIQIFYFYFLRIKDFSGNSMGRVILSIATASINILLGYLAFGNSGLVIGTTLGALISLLYYLIRTKEKIKTGSFRSFFSNKKNSISVIKKYKDFILINSPHALSENLFELGLIFIIAFYFNDAVVGFYAFAFRILKAPVGLIGSSLYQVLYQKLTEYHHQGKNMRPVILSIYKQLLLLALPGFGILFIFTPQIFAFIFGDKWTEAGVIAQILIPWLFLNFLASPVSSLTLILQKQKIAFLITLSDMLLRITAFILAGMTGDYKLAFLSISVIGSASMLFAIIWYYKIAGNVNE